MYIQIPHTSVSHELTSGRAVVRTRPVAPVGSVSVSAGLRCHPRVSEATDPNWTWRLRSATRSPRYASSRAQPERYKQTKMVDYSSHNEHKRTKKTECYSSYNEHKQIEEGFFCIKNTNVNNLLISASTTNNIAIYIIVNREYAIQHIPGPAYLLKKLTVSLHWF